MRQLKQSIEYEYNESDAAIVCTTIEQLKKILATYFTEATVDLYLWEMRIILTTACQMRMTKLNSGFTADINSGMCVPRLWCGLQ